MRVHRLALSAIAFLVLGTAVTAISIGGSEGQALSGEYKIGVLEPLTGPLAFEGKRHLDGYEAMRDMINAAGGVMGKRLVFVVATPSTPPRPPARRTASSPARV